MGGRGKLGLEIELEVEGGAPFWREELNEGTCGYRAIGRANVEIVSVPRSALEDLGNPTDLKIEPAEAVVELVGDRDRVVELIRKWTKEEVHSM